MTCERRSTKYIFGPLLRISRVCFPFDPPPPPPPPPPHVLPFWRALSEFEAELSKCHKLLGHPLRQQNFVSCALPLFSLAVGWYCTCAHSAAPLRVLLYFPFLMLFYCPSPPPSCSPLAVDLFIHWSRRAALVIAFASGCKKFCGGMSSNKRLALVRPRNNNLRTIRILLFFYGGFEPLRYKARFRSVCAR